MSVLIGVIMMSTRAKVTRVYVAGPMTGYVDKNFPAFTRAAKALRESGYVVINPAELDADEPERTWEACLRRDIKQLVTCDAVAVLDGCIDSRGARLEIYIARALNMSVFPVSTYITKVKQRRLS